MRQDRRRPAPTTTLCLPVRSTCQANHTTRLGRAYRDSGEALPHESYPVPTLTVPTTSRDRPDIGKIR